MLRPLRKKKDDAAKRTAEAAARRKLDKESGIVRVTYGLVDKEIKACAVVGRQLTALDTSLKAWDERATRDIDFQTWAAGNIDGLKKAVAAPRHRSLVSEIDALTLSSDASNDFAKQFFKNRGQNSLSVLAAFKTDVGKVLKIASHWPSKTWPIGPQFCRCQTNSH